MQHVEAYLREVLGDGVVASVAVEPAALDAMLACDHLGDALAWIARDDDAWSIAGRGRAASLEGATLGALATESTRVLRRLRVVAHPSCADAPRPRMFGGQRFDPRDTRDDRAWKGFPAASLALPRWQVARRGGRAVLTVSAVEAGDAEQCLRELRDVVSALQEGAGEASVRASEARDDREAWRSLVAEALATMRAGAAEKLVGARRSEVIADRPWALASVMRALGGASGCVRFAVEHQGSAFVGATPERLVARRGLDVEADALAGSVARAEEAGEDRARAEALLRGDKERREHAFVVDALRASLERLCASVSAPERPAVRTLRTLHHLATPMRGRLREVDPAHVLALVDALHPTPALGGSPRHVALDWIAAHEAAPRGWYGGPVGWCDAEGDGEFFVAIRSAVLRGERAWMYAGAGLVEGSDPDMEYDETEAKMAPMRAALGVRSER